MEPALRTDSARAVALAGSLAPLVRADQQREQEFPGGDQVPVGREKRGSARASGAEVELRGH